MENTKSFDAVFVYTILGFLLGTFPPLAILGVTVYSDYQNTNQDKSDIKLAGLAVIIVIICAVVGTALGAFIGFLMSLLRKYSLIFPLLLAPFVGFLWGIITGGAGGFPVFIIGAIFGAIFAAPFGVVGFFLFAAIYETLARRRPLKIWQGAFIAFGVVALIMSGVVFYYALAPKT